MKTKFSLGQAGLLLLLLGFATWCVIATANGSIPALLS